MIRLRSSQLVADGSILAYCSEFVINWDCMVVFVLVSVVSLFICSPFPF